MVLVFLVESPRILLYQVLCKLDLVLGYVIIVSRLEIAGVIV